MAEYAITFAKSARKELETLNATLSRPKDVLLQIKNALLAQDHVLLADILQYEFTDVTEMWHSLIARLNQEAADRGGISVKSESRSRLSVWTFGKELRRRTRQATILFARRTRKFWQYELVNTRVLTGTGRRITRGIRPRALQPSSEAVKVQGAFRSRFSIQTTLVQLGLQGGMIRWTSASTNCFPTSNSALS